MRVLITGAGGFIGRALTEALIARGWLAGPGREARPVTELILADRSAPPDPGAPSPIVTRLTGGDLTDPAALEAALSPPPDAIFHLAATLTLEAEQDPVRGWEINVELPRRLLEAGRLAGNCPRLVYASSIAAFGGDLPSQVSDAQAQTPATSYGTAKAIVELLINDYARKGHVDGRALRLPIVLTRPGAPAPAVSDRVAAMAREPLRGRAFAAPLGEEDRFPVVSVGRVAANLLRMHDLPASAFGISRAANQPGLTVCAADIRAALARAAGPEAAARLTCAPDPGVRAVVAGWPRDFVTGLDFDPPLAPDPDFDAVIADFLTREARAVPG
ncbi:MAG: NAD-dependent epimerase [Rhodobacteraceae bacterium]|nr:NAD-dependent epimerase [Paracoccaceae bacterium]MBR28956.1 NAD-dependent epimerase [Paracoccaceae bacterium]